MAARVSSVRKQYHEQLKHQQAGQTSGHEPVNASALNVDIKPSIVITLTTKGKHDRTFCQSECSSQTARRSAH
jgi:hypothetical protein